MNKIKIFITIISFLFLLPLKLYAGKNVLLYTDDFASSYEEVERIGGRTTHKLTDRVFVADLPDSVETTPLQLKYASEAKPSELDDLSESMVRCWLESMKPQTETGKIISWANSKREYPRNSYNDSKLRKQARFVSQFLSGSEQSLVSPAPTSQFMSGRIAVGIEIVSGESETGKGDYLFTKNERDLIFTQVMRATNFLVKEGRPSANITFYYTIPLPKFGDREVRVIAKPGTNTNSYEDMEAPWRDAALSALGFYCTGLCGVSRLVDEIKNMEVAPGLKPDWAYVAFFTKYPLAWEAYASGQRIVISNRVVTWDVGLNAVFAHETCHLFGAADEYNGNDPRNQSRCTCESSGVNNVPNSNCINCISAGKVQQPCIMNANTLQMCPYTRGQVGWKVTLPSTTTLQAKL